MGSGLCRDDRVLLDWVHAGSRATMGTVKAITIFLLKWLFYWAMLLESIIGLLSLGLIDTTLALLVAKSLARKRHNWKV